MHRDLEDDVTAALVRTVSPGERETLRVMVRESEELAGTRARRRRPRGRALAALITAGVLAIGGTSAAVAGPEVWKWLRFTPDASTTLVLPSGITCKSAYAIDTSRTMTPEEAEAAAFAQEYLRTLDLTSLPFDEAAAQLEAAGLASPDSSAESEAEHALNYAIQTRISTALDENGYADVIWGMNGQGICE